MERVAHYPENIVLSGWSKRLAHFLKDAYFLSMEKYINKWIPRKEMVTIHK